MEDYKEKYEEALDNFKKIKDANKDNNELVNFIEYEYPELTESEDEKMIDLLIAIFEVNHPNDLFKINPKNTVNMKYMSTEKIVDWLKSLKERMKGE